MLAIAGAGAEEDSDSEDEDESEDRDDRETQSHNLASIEEHIYEHLPPRVHKGTDRLQDDVDYGLKQHHGTAMACLCNV